MGSRWTIPPKSVLLYLPLQIHSPFTWFQKQKAWPWVTNMGWDDNCLEVSYRRDCLEFIYFVEIEFFF